MEPTLFPAWDRVRHCDEVVFKWYLSARPRESPYLGIMLWVLLKWITDLDPGMKIGVLGCRHRYA